VHGGLAINVLTSFEVIGQVMTGDNAARRAEDIGGQELSFAEVKAIASGNPAVLTLAEADAELQRLTLLKKNHLDEQYVARRSVRDLPGTIASLSQRLSKLAADEATANAHAGDPITIAGRRCSREDSSAVLAGQLDALPRYVRDTTRKPLGIYRGLRFGMVLHPQFPPDVYLEGAATRQSGSLREHQGRVSSSTPSNAWPAATAPIASESGKTSPSPNRSCAITRHASANRSSMIHTFPN
jgi:hypothetical protein